MRFAFSLVLFSTLAMPQTTFLQNSPDMERIDGIIGDSACGISHTVAGGLGAAGCTRYCVVRGAHYVLISGQHIYQLTGDSKVMDEFAGVPRTMIGRREGDTFHLTAIAE